VLDLQPMVLSLEPVVPLLEPMEPSCTSTEMVPLSMLVVLSLDPMVHSLPEVLVPPSTSVPMVP